MRKILFAILLFGCIYSDAQVFYRRSEYGFAAGGANYFGDINPNLGFQSSKYSGGIFIKYNFTPYIALKLAGNYAHVEATDKNSSNVFQKARNLDFKSNIYETVLQSEFNFFQYAIGDFDYRFTPYVTLGIGLFWYNPYTTLDNKTYYLRPLGTEGQNYDQYKDRKYKNTAMSFPIGAGFKFWMARGITVGVEVANRLTTTDYLDDVSATYVGKDKFLDQEPTPYPTSSFLLQDRSTEVSPVAIGAEGRQRGISSTKDQYMMFQLLVSFRLPTYKCPSNQE